MTIQEAMKKIFDEHKKPMAEWIRITGLSRQQIYRWRNGQVENIRGSSLVTVAKAVGYKAIFKNGGVELKKNESIDINLLKEYSNSLEDKIKTLKFEIEEISLLQWRLKNFYFGHLSAAISFHHIDITSRHGNLFFYVDASRKPVV